MDIRKTELFNVLTSLPGALAAPVGLVALLTTALRQGDPWKVVSFGIYGGTLLLLYCVTTLYHLLQGSRKPVLRELDHLAIYLLIAGTYTPFSLVTLRGPWGWTLLGIVWGLAVFGIALQQWPGKLPKVPDLVLYLAMGWVILIALRPLLHAMPWQGVAWLGIGGFFYTGGIVFFLIDDRFARAHGFWHLCVLAGSVSHYLAIALYIA